jgi:hypothetical protein
VAESQGPTRPNIAPGKIKTIFNPPGFHRRSTGAIRPDIGICGYRASSDVCKCDGLRSAAIAGNRGANSPRNLVVESQGPPRPNIAPGKIETIFDPRGFHRRRSSARSGLTVESAAIARPPMSVNGMACDLPPSPETAVLFLQETLWPKVRDRRDPTSHLERSRTFDPRGFHRRRFVGAIRPDSGICGYRASSDVCKCDGLRSAAIAGNRGAISPENLSSQRSGPPAASPSYSQRYTFLPPDRHRPPSHTAP